MRCADQHIYLTAWDGPDPAASLSSFQTERTLRSTTSLRQFWRVSNLTSRPVPLAALQDEAGSLGSRCWIVSIWWRHVCFPRTKSLSDSATNSQVIFNSYASAPDWVYYWPTMQNWELYQSHISTEMYKPKFMPKQKASFSFHRFVLFFLYHLLKHHWSREDIYQFQCSAYIPSSAHCLHHTFACPWRHWTPAALPSCTNTDCTQHLALKNVLPIPLY